jgi:hypothetical protein
LDIEQKLAKLGQTGKIAQNHLQMSPHEHLWNDLTEHVGRAHEAFGSFGEKLGDVGQSLNDVLPMLASIGSVGSVAGLFEMAHATAEAAEALHNTAIIAGVTVPQLQGLNYAAKQVGITTDQLSMGMARLNQHLANATLGHDKRSAALFAQMGISLRDASGHMKSANEILPQLMTAFQNTTNPALRTAAAMQLFGRAGVQMLPFLTMGSAKLDELTGKFSELGYSFSSNDLENLQKFNDSWKDMETSIGGLTSAIGADLAPVLGPMIEEFSEWLAANRAWIATDIRGVVTDLADDLKNINVKSIVGDFRHFVHVGGRFVDIVGGMQTVLIGAGAVMAGAFLAPLIGLTAQFGALALAMGAPIAGAVADLVVGLAGVIPEVKSLRDVWAALDLVMDANPLGVAVLAAVALGTAGYELYRHWDYASKEMGKAFQYIDEKFQEVFGPIENTIGRVTQSLGGLASDIGLGGNDAPAGSSPARAPIVSPFQSRFGNINQGQQAGQVDVNVHFNNPPAGTVVGAKASRGAKMPSVNIGRNTLLGHT